MSNSFRWISGLTGERLERHIKVRKRQIFVGIILASAMLPLVLFDISGYDNLLLILLIIVLVVDLTMSFVRKETLWQLRKEERQATKDASTKSLEELLRHAEKVKQGKHEAK